MIGLGFKKHLRSLAGLYSVKAVSAALDVGFFVVSGHLLDIRTFGEFALYLMVYMIAIPFVSLGSNQLIMKKAEVESIIFVLKRLIYSSLVILLLLILLPIVQYIFQGRIDFATILYISFLLFVNITYNFLRSHYQAHLLFKKFNLISICTSALSFIIPILFIARLDMGLGALYARMVIPGIIGVVFFSKELFESKECLNRINLSFKDVKETIYITGGGVIDAIAQQMVQVFTAYTGSTIILGIANRAEYVRVNGFQQVYVILSSYLNVKIANTTDILVNLKKLRYIYIYYLYINFITYSVGIIALPILEFVFSEEYELMLSFIYPLILLAWGIAQVSFYLNMSILKSDYKVVSIYSFIYAILLLGCAFLAKDYIFFVYGNILAQLLARVAVLFSSKFLRSLVFTPRVLITEFILLMVIFIMMTFNKLLIFLGIGFIILFNNLKGFRNEYS